MTKKFSLAAAVLALLAAADPAHAATIEWDLVNVNNTSGIGLTGFFDYDTVANSGSAEWSPIANYSITETGVEPTPFTFSSSTGSQLFAGLGGSEISLFQNGPSEPTFLPGDFGLAAAGLLSSLGTDTIMGGIVLPPSNSSEPDIFGSIEGRDVSAAPLPPALPMFGSALLALAGFAAWSRRRAVRG